MARRLFFVPEIRRGFAELTGPEAEHLVRVLRAEAGQVYELSDNQDLYLGEIEVARKSLVTFRILEKLETPLPSVSIWLFPALFKFDRFEWLIEKAVELGVDGIQPFDAARTDRGLGEASKKRVNRWEKIAIEASQQSRRVHLPTIGSAVSLRQVLKSDLGVKLLLDEEAGAPPVLTILPEVRSAADRVGLLLGPEGGWTEAEREECIRAGWQRCSLGRAILRSETAALAGVAIVQAAWL